MSRVAPLLAAAILAAAPATAKVLVIDDWSSPSPATTVTVTQNTRFDNTGPYNRSVRWQTVGSQPNGASLSFGDGRLQYAPGAGTVGYTSIAYGAYTGAPTNLNLVEYKFARLKIVSDGVLNLKVVFISNTPGDVGYAAGVDVVGTGTVYIPLVWPSSNFDPTRNWGLGTLIDQSGSGVSAYTLREFAFTTTDSPVPEPATWAMMIIGFGLVGGTVRLRDRRQPGAVAA